MTGKLFASALIAGALAGALAAALQFAFVVPLLLEGELYETGARVHFTDGSAESPSGVSGIGIDLARHGLTLAMALVTWIGLALILAAGFAVAARRGATIGAARGAVWGAVGFFALNLAPAAGLPPELPGTIAAELVPRQVWWMGTIVATLAGAILIATQRRIVGIIAGAIVILAPHAIGAPHLDTHFGVAPPELAALFATRTLAVAAAVWLALGTSAGWLWSRDQT